MVRRVASPEAPHGQEAQAAPATNPAPDLVLPLVAPEGALTGLSSAVDVPVGPTLQEEADARFAAGDVEGAITLWRTIVAADREDLWSLLALVDALFALDRAGEAALALHEARQHRPANRQLMALLAETERRQGRFELALPLYEALQAERPLDAPGDVAGFVECLVAAKRLEPALKEAYAAIRRWPDEAGLRFWLARALEEACEQQKAADAYRACLARDPENTLGAAERMAALSEGRPETLPAAFVRSLFDQYAHRFSKHLVEKLGYRGPALLRAALEEAVGAPLAGRGWSVLDLGCGTGLSGEVLADLAGELHGVDLSERMLEEAAGRGIYTSLAAEDVVSAVTRLPGGQTGAGWDLVMACDVLNYIGALETLFGAVAGKLAPGGLFALTIERLDAGQADAPLDFTFQESRRFAHSPAYVRQVAEAAGLALRLERFETLRVDRNVPVIGGFYVLERAG
jgi:predicted TPR repeat methyltransferase